MKLPHLVVFTSFLFVFLSCDWNKKNIKPIDFNSVDEYPVFESCKDKTTQADIKACFEKVIVTQIQATIDTLHIAPDVYVNNEALFVYIDVKNNGTCVVNEIENLHKVELEIPELSNAIYQSIQTLPSVTPAKKRGQYVNSRFMVPLTIEK